MRVTSIALCLLVAGCRAPEPVVPTGPLALPEGLVIETRHFAGTWLSGPQVREGAAPPDSGPASALRLHASLLLVEHPVAPSAELAPLAGRVRLVADTETPEVVRAPSRLTMGGGLLRGAAARELFASLGADAHGGSSHGRSARLLDVEEVLLEGATTAFVARCDESSEDPAYLRQELPPAGPVTKYFAAAVEWIDGSAPPCAGVVLYLGDFAPLLARELEARLPGQSDPPLRAGMGEMRRELLKLADTVEVGGEPLCVLLPAPFRGGEGRSCAIYLELLAAPEPGSGDAVAHDAAIARAWADIAAESERAAALRRVAAPGNVRERAIARALGDLAADATRRPLLIFVASATGALLMADLALALEDVALVALLDRLVQDRANAPAAGDEGKALGWWLERHAWRHLVAMAAQGDLPPGVTSILLRHAGAAGRYPGLLDDAARECGDTAAFAQRLRDENHAFLTDRSPAVRVRAFDWLLARGAAPAGYDPLAPPAERAAALAPPPRGEDGHE